MASDICWISARTTPAPIAWTVPAGIRMQSPTPGSKRGVGEARSPIPERSSAAYAFDSSRSVGLRTIAGSPR